MTGNLADVDGVPTTSLVTYYAQRAGAGLIVTEGTKPSATGYGCTDAPLHRLPRARAGRMRPARQAGLHGA